MAKKKSKDVPFHIAVGRASRAIQDAFKAQLSWKGSLAPEDRDEFEDQVKTLRHNTLVVLRSLAARCRGARLDFSFEVE